MQTAASPTAVSFSRSLTCSRTQQAIALTEQIASSGEGEVWRTNRAGYLAKIYHKLTPERIRKLEVMVNNPPHDPNAKTGHISFAWVYSLLQDTWGQTVGFLMPAIADSVELLDVYNPSRRRKVLPGFNWLYLHTTAVNIASIMQAIHVKGYVLGDVKSQNILVNNRALPSIIDTDSFQVKHPDTGEVFFCPVGSEGFTPVELLDKDLALTEQTEVHDRFRLAVIIHLLLFGDHPFKGQWMGQGESPSPLDLLRQGLWAYSQDELIKPSSLTIPLQTVHPALQRCFLRCFNEGHHNPLLRPSAAEWVQALQLAIADLKPCPKRQRHYYSGKYGRCLWCERKAKLGMDIFPDPPSLSTQMVQKMKRRSQSLSKSMTTAAENTRFRLSKKVSRLPVKAQTQQQLHKALRNFTGQSPHRSSTAQKPSSQKSISPAPSAPPLQLPDLSLQQILQLGGGVLGAIAALFVLVTLSSASGIDQENIGLTTVGIVLTLGLLGICLFWKKILE
jgi:serine/threonine protein kinase